MLAKELKDLEQHGLIKCTVYADSPVLVEYTPEPYARSLEPVIKSLLKQGENHRKRLRGK